MALTQISTNGIKDATIATADIADDAVTSAKIADDAITSALIADDAITSALIADDAIVAAAIADNAVVTAAINADAVTGAKIADDAVGAEHIEVLDANLQFADDATIRLGTGNDLELWHNGTNSYVRNNTGNLLIGSGGFTAIYGGEDYGEYSATFTDNGAVDLYYDGTKKLETTSGGIKVTGNDGVTIVGAQDNSADLFFHADGGDDNADKWYAGAYADGTFHVLNYASGSWEESIKANGDGQVELYYDNSKKLETTSIGVNITGGDSGGSYIVGDMYWDNGTNAGRDVHWDQSDNIWNYKDDVKVTIGNGNDLSLYHDGTNSYIDSNQGSLFIRGAQGTIKIRAHNDEESIVCNSDGAVELYHNNVKQLETASTGVQITGYLGFESTGKVIHLADSREAVFGTGEDLKIYHDGSNSYIDNHTGDLIIRGEDDNIILQAVDGENSIKCNPNGSVHLYYDNVDTFSTTSTGANITFSADNSTVAGGLFINNTTANTGNNASIIFSTDSGNRKKSCIAHQDTGNYGRGDLVVSIDPDADSGSLDVNAHEKVRFQAAGGISFNGDSTQANSLQDYEEGTFTPGLANGFHSGATFYKQSGLYVKIGSHVLATFYIHLNEADTNNALIQIGNLPYTSTNALHNGDALSPGGGNLTYHNLTANDSAHSASCYLSSNVSYISLYRDGGGENFRGANNQSQDGKWIVGYVNYFTDA